MDSEAVQSFCGVTGAEPDVAEQYLQVADRNVERAITLFFENGGQPLQAQGGAGAAPAAGPALGDDEVRAPIASRADVLVDGYGGGSAYHEPYGGIPIRHHHHMGGGGPAAAAAAASIFAQQPRTSSVPFRDFAQEAAEMTGGAESSSRRSRLADLFKPPFELMRAASLASARQLAEREAKWVLINLQDLSEFRCQALNRDVWSQETVREVVRAGYVFFQLPIDNAEGVRVATMYAADAYPFIAAVHPKTGELRARFARYTDLADFIEDLSNFSLNNPLSGRSGSGSGSAAGSGASRPASGARARPLPGVVYNMTEEEQLAAAIAASELSSSTQDNGAPVVVHSESEASSYGDIESISSGGPGMDVDDAGPAPEPQPGPADANADADAWYRQLPATEPPEPPAGPGATRIQLRFPDGRRVVRRFALDDRVAVVFQFLRATQPGAAASVPEVLFLGNRLADAAAQTIAAAGLANASVVVDV
ncbi:UBX domain protein Ubx2 [Coemansia javaensis]|uniref:UBX domain protein Ubx2 n=1 Tax=Coemansia javaensis TaxID=2761396 RepID=A0A9W8LEM0_9FUNG|nr:UBX domain protein Ubx2 [Coemansia javaensis]